MVENFENVRYNCQLYQLELVTGFPDMFGKGPCKLILSISHFQFDWPIGPLQASMIILRFLFEWLTSGNFRGQVLLLLACSIVKQ